MSLTQNEKIRQVTETPMVIGVDIASEIHWARAFDWRGLELGEGHQLRKQCRGIPAIHALGIRHGYERAERPCGRWRRTNRAYWFTLAGYLQNNGAKLVLVNPYHVKRSKELDDNHPRKNDRKNPKTVAKLVCWHVHN